MLRIHAQEKVLEIDIPTLKISDYSLEELFEKDMFFIHGKNIYLRDIEQVVTSKFGYRCAACGVNDSAAATNYIYLFVECGDPEKVPVKALKDLVFSEMGFGLKEVIPLRSLVLTGTGKIAKEKLLAAYKEGKI